MTNQEIKDYFGQQTVYRFDGSLKDLQSLMESQGISYNYIVDQYQVYFIAYGLVSDNRAVLLED